MLRLAVPTGRLWTDSLRLLGRLGVHVDPADRRYALRHNHLDLEVIALKIPDIPRAIGDGLVDLAVASDEWLFEHDLPHLRLTPLCWYHARVCLLAPHGRAAALPFQVHSPVSVATPYPGITRRLMGVEEGDCQVRAVRGAVEAYPGRLTDLAVDCVESGATIRRNGLVEVRTLLQCDVRLVRAPSASHDDELVRHVVEIITSEAAHPRCLYADRIPSRELLG